MMSIYLHDPVVSFEAEDLNRKYMKSISCIHHCLTPEKNTDMLILIARKKARLRLKGTVRSKGQTRRLCTVKDQRTKLDSRLLISVL